MGMLSHGAAASSLDALINLCGPIAQQTEDVLALRAYVLTQPWDENQDDVLAFIDAAIAWAEIGSAIAQKQLAKRIAFAGAPGEMKTGMPPVFLSAEEGT